MNYNPYPAANTFSRIDIPSNSSFISSSPNIFVIFFFPPLRKVLLRSFWMPTNHILHHLPPSPAPSTKLPLTNWKISVKASFATPHLGKTTAASRVLQSKLYQAFHSSELYSPHNNNNRRLIDMYYRMGPKIRGNNYNAITERWS